MTSRESMVATIAREFLGWNRPALPEATRRLAARYRQGRTLNLGQVVVVVPGQRAGRRLQELLVFLAEEENLCLTPPEVVTEGRLPELLYMPKRPFANDLVQDLAWAQALRDLPRETRRHLVPQPPAIEDGLRWLQLGKVLRDLHVELARDGLDFEAVAKAGRNLAGFSELERWQALLAIQQRYLRLLDAHELWDRETARLKAIEYREITTNRDIVLLATVDLNDTLRQMLDQAAERVTAYIVAPENMAERFDRMGCLVSSAWCDAAIPLSDEQLVQVDGPEEQTDAVSAWLAELGGHFRLDEITIGVPDPALAPQLQRQLEQCSVPARWVEMVKLGDTAPYRLLAVAAQYAGRHRYGDLAALIRHPDLEDWLQFPSARSRPVASLANQLDHYYIEHLPGVVGNGGTLHNVGQWPELASALKQIETWLSEACATHPLRAWGRIFRKMLGEAYGKRTLTLDHPDEERLHRAFREILKVLDRLDDIPETLDTVSLAATDAFQIVLGPAASEPLPPPAGPEVIEVLGWLELPLDDAPALAVTSFNEGFVPKATGADPFLPDRLRRELGMLHNDRRYARDAYATTVLCQSRQNLRVVFARRDTNKDPLQPSRLIFACSNEEMVRRARRYFGERDGRTAERRLLLAGGGPIPEKSAFEVPRPEPGVVKLEHVSVTRFKAYLACPYRYYLRHVRKLEAVDDSARELDGGAFGTLLHRVLGDFGRNTSGPRYSERQEEIVQFLRCNLEEQAEKLYGRDCRRPAIRLQLEQARQRLSAFASQHVTLVRDGWRIVYVEDDGEGENGLSTAFVVDGQPIMLVGRIDRIDFHSASRTLRILDYKTSDSAVKPEQSHRKKESWIDLQLPLYRHLRPQDLPNVPAECVVELGYFNLPKQLDKSEVAIAEWDAATLANADETARQVIRALRGEIFWPPVYDPVPDFNEDLAAICLDNVLGRPVLAQNGDGGRP